MIEGFQMTKSVCGEPINRFRQEEIAKSRTVGVRSQEEEQHIVVLLPHDSLLIQQTKATRLLNSSNSPCCRNQLKSHIQPSSATSRALSSINPLCYLHFQLFDPEQRIDSKYESNSALMPAQWLSGEEPCQPVAFAHKARAFFTPVCKDK